jgi:DNA repair protein RecO (recombination protein O)
VPRVVLQPCFVLHSRPFRETSQLLELLTRDLGRVGVLARGSRRAGRGSPASQAFHPLAVSWSGRGELPTVTAVEADGRPFLFRGSKIAGALYLNELTMRLLHRGDPHPEIYTAYHQALERLAVPDSTEQVYRVFEKRLLESLGYALELVREAATGKPVDAASRYRYQLGHGPVAIGGDDVAAASSSGEPTVRGHTLLALNDEALVDEGDLAEAKRLMRFVINAQLEGRPLETRQLFRGTR